MCSQVCWPIFWGSLKRAALKRCDNAVHVEAKLENSNLFLDKSLLQPPQGWLTKNSWDFSLGLPWHKAVHSFWVLVSNKCMLQGNIKVLSLFPLWFFKFINVSSTFQCHTSDIFSKGLLITEGAKVIPALPASKDKKEINGQTPSPLSILQHRKGEATPELPWNQKKLRMYNFPWFPYWKTALSARI